MDRLRSWDQGRLEAWPRCVGFASEAAMVEHNAALSQQPPTAYFLPFGHF